MRLRYGAVVAVTVLAAHRVSVIAVVIAVLALPVTDVFAVVDPAVIARKRFLFGEFLFVVNRRSLCI